MLRRAPRVLAPVLLALGLALTGGCKDEVEAIPDDPPSVEDDEWLNAIGEDEPAEIAAAEPAAAQPVAAVAEPAAAADTEGAAAAPAQGAAGEAPAPTEAAARGEVAAAGGDAPRSAAKGGSGGSTGPAAAAEAPAPAPAEEAPAAPSEVVAEAPAEPAPAAEPAPPPEPVQPAAPPPITMADFAGTYSYSGGSGQRQALADAIDKAAEGVSALIRGIARKRLTKTQILETPITISVSGDTVSFKLGTTGGSWSAKIDGPLTSMTYNGDKYKVRVQDKGTKLVTVFKAPDATKTIVYVLSSDRKRLTAHHRLVADKLAEPMTFKVSYTRK